MALRPQWLRPLGGVEGDPELELEEIEDGAVTVLRGLFENPERVAVLQFLQLLLPRGDVRGRGLEAGVQALLPLLGGGGPMVGWGREPVLLRLDLGSQLFAALGDGFVLLLGLCG